MHTVRRTELDTDTRGRILVTNCTTGHFTRVIEGEKKKCFDSQVISQRQFSYNITPNGIGRYFCTRMWYTLVLIHTAALSCVFCTKCSKQRIQTEFQYHIGEISPTRCKNCVFYSQWLYSTCFG